MLAGTEPGTLAAEAVRCPGDVEPQSKPAEPGDGGAGATGGGPESIDGCACGSAGSAGVVPGSE
ncbi:MAG: hypothetical protein NVS3B27_16510 [Novosphingobium sp.]